MIAKGWLALPRLSSSLLEGPGRRIPSKADDDRSISSKTNLRCDKKLRSSMQKSRTVLPTTSRESGIGVTKVLLLRECSGAILGGGKTFLKRKVSLKLRLH